MATLLTLSVNRDKVQFNEKGWANITISIDDATNQYGQNASGWNQQTKEEREAKEARTYVGNGKVVWTDGNIVVADKVEQQLSTAEQSLSGRETPDLPF